MAGVNRVKFQIMGPILRVTTFKRGAHGGFAYVGRLDTTREKLAEDLKDPKVLALLKIAPTPDSVS